MKTTKYFLFVLFIVLAGGSCTREIEFTDELLDPKLVINGLCKLDNIAIVEISSSKAIPGYHSEIRLITDAQARLYKNGVLFDTLICTMSDTTSGIYRGTKPIESGENYHIEVERQGFTKAISAEAQICNKVPILAATASTELLNSDYPDNQPKIKSSITFSDPADEENYYLLDISYRVGKRVSSTSNLIQVGNYYSLSESVESNDPVLAESNTADNLVFDQSSSKYTLFNDKLFNGKTYKLNFFLNHSICYRLSKADTSNGEFYIITFELQTLTRDTYLYLKSSGTLDDLSGGLFTEPVQINSNINGGLGIWGICSPAFDSLKIGRFPLPEFTYNNYSVSY